jgi:hypothetical protein
MEVFKDDFARLQGQAYDQALRLAQELLTQFVEQLATNAPENLPSIQTVPMQQAILNAQKSAAVVGDDELTATLVDILVDKSGTEPRSFKGVVLTEALEVAGKLTADQVNLLTALVMIDQTISHSWFDDVRVFESLDALCQPLYGKIPTISSALNYMSYTGVGSIETMELIMIGTNSLLNKISQKYNAVFTTGFELTDLSAELRSVCEEVKDAENILVPLPDKYGAGRYRFRLASASTVDRYIPDDGHPLSPHKEEMKNLITKNQLPVPRFREILSAEKPDVLKFLEDLDSVSAGSFRLSTVGIAIGQANWRRLQPQSAPDVDMYLA